ncbi:ABC transporter permease [Thermoleophilia bacterium SCSIO 60948]|nr:ABC transporter permease [Thermoleophilia bacterium SCSIO 60948]
MGGLRGGARAAGWVLGKDLRLLRRSPLTTALLVIYPILIAVLIGFALSRGPDKPRVAFVNEIPASQEASVGGTEFDKESTRAELCSRIECVDAASTDEARRLVADGEVIAALILPEDFVDQLRSLGGLNPTQPTVEVLVNEEDPIKAQLVNDRIRGLVTEANLILSQAISEQAGNYLDLIVSGGQFSLPLLGGEVDILGLDNAAEILNEVRADLPPSSEEGEALDRVIRFAELAAENLDFALPLLGAIAEPITVDTEVVNGGATSLDSFAIGVAATITLMFVTVLLVAGSLALEREENAYARLARGLLPPGLLLAEKIALGVVASVLVTGLMLGGLSAFVAIELANLPAIVAAVLLGGAAFAAFGAALGALARDVRASSLLAFMVSLPIAFLSLVPSGTVGAGVYKAIEIVRAGFPFDATLDAVSVALDGSGSLAGPVVNLAALIVVYGALARVGLRRFG